MERMSGAEAVMWAVEKDPALRSDFCNVTVLDRPPDRRRLREKVEAALVAMPRLAQRVVSAPLGLAPPAWRPDPTLDLDYHLREIAVPAPAGHRQLLDTAAALCAPPLDRSRPLWEFTVLTGLEGGRAALVQKVHHTITDGVGGLRLSLSLVDLERDPAPGATNELRAALATEERSRVVSAVRDSPLAVLRDTLDDTVRRDLTLARSATAAGLVILVRPTEVPRRARDVAALVASLARQVAVTDRARSSLMRDRSLARRYDTFEVPLEDARRVGSALGGSVNDVFVTGVTGALGLYHERLGSPVDELRMAMPVSTRGSGDAGANRFAPTRVLVPVGPKDPRTRFDAVRARLHGVRDEPALGAADVVAGLVAGLPTSLLVALTRSQTRTIDFATSNLRGSPVDLYLAGARIERNHPMGPRTGCALNVTLLSYRGDMCIGLHSDPAAITDPDALLDAMRESFDALLFAA